MTHSLQRYSMRRNFGLVLMASIVLATLSLLFVESAQASSHRALINGGTVSGSYSQEQAAAVAAGFDVTVVSNSVWQAMSAAQFGEYELLIIGDPTCSGVGFASANFATWAPVVMGTAGGRTLAGNRVVVGTDPVYHGRSTGHVRTTILREGIAYAGKQPGRTGLYYSTSCSWAGDANIDSALEALSTGTGSWTAGSSPCGGSVSLIASEPTFATLTSSSLQGWGCSVHAAWQTFPTDWSALAVATDAPTKPTCGVDPNTGLSACGQAYILIAGSSIVVVSGSISVSPLDATNPVNTDHTIWAHLTSGGTDLVGQVVDFTVTGQNAGALGVCAPVTCASDSNGMVSFTYTGSNGAGDDTIKASFVDAAGSLQAATAAKHWIAPTNVDPIVTVADAAVTTPEGTVAGNTGSVSDADGDIVTLTSSVGSVTNNGDGTWTWSNAAPDGPDAYVVTIDADDGNGGTDSTTFSVAVTNVAPVANAGADQIGVLRNSTVSVTGTWTDPALGLDDLYGWTWDLDGDALTDDSGSSAYGVGVGGSTVFALPGSYTLTFGVTDEDGDTGSDQVLIEVINRAPDCSLAEPSIDSIWPPNHKFVAINVLGVTDADGDDVTIEITGIEQDEPLNTLGDGATEIDGRITNGGSTAEVRAERSGTKKVPGDGRIYEISYTASDDFGGSCSGSVLVGVPHDQGKKGSVVVDSVVRYDSTGA